MAVPKRKRSHQRINKRFANKGIKVKALTKCSNCQEVIAPHQVCSSCGHYKGKKVIVTKKERALKRAQSKQSKKSKEAIKATAKQPKVGEAVKDKKASKK
jgi:large subunit ribosomal protein L32